MVAALALAALLPSLAAAATCVQFDSDFNLYAFGGDKDVKLGPASSWGSPAPTDLTTQNRPPFNGDNMQCFLSQYNNAMYVFGGDKSDVGSIYIYDFKGDSWSKQATTGAPDQLSNSRSAAILDHDTNVIFTIPGGGKAMYSASLDSVKNVASGSVAWEEVGTPAIKTDGPVTAALSNNHINYFGVPGNEPGSASLFVIHFSAWQPQPQKYPTLNGGATFPDQSGQAVSFPTANGGPQSMLFVPDDFSNSYVVTHWTNLGDYASQDQRPMAAELVNSTQILPAPTSKDKNAAYACSDTSCAQIDSNGDIYYIENALGTDFAVKSGAAWTKMGYSLGGGSSSSNGTSTDSNNSTPSGTLSGSSASGSHAATGSGSPTSKNSASSTPSSGAASLNSGVFGVALGALAVAAASLL